MWQPRRAAIASNRNAIVERALSNGASISAKPSVVLLSIVDPPASMPHDVPAVGHAVDDDVEFGRADARRQLRLVDAALFQREAVGEQVDIGVAQGHELRRLGTR